MSLLYKENRIATGAAENDPLGSDLQAVLLSAIHRQYNAKKAIFISDQCPEGSLERLRAFLYRNKLEQAWGEIKLLQPSAPTTELLSEASRLACYQGEWSHALYLADYAMRGDALGTTQLVLLQVKALALYELGDYYKSRSCIEEIKKRASLFPNSNPILFARITAVLCSLFDQGPGAARCQLIDLTQQVISEKNLTLESLLFLTRARIAIARKEGSPFEQEANLCLSLARSMGLELYEGLALFDLKQALGTPLDPSLEECLLEFSKKFSRIKSLLELNLNPAHSNQAPDSTHRLIAEFARLPRRGSPNQLNGDHTLTVALLPLHKVGINLQEGTVQNLNLSSTQTTAITLLGQTGSMTKEDYFCKLWELRKFVPYLHGDTLRKQIKRLSIKVSTEIEQKGDLVVMPHARALDF